MQESNDLILKLETVCSSETNHIALQPTRTYPSSVLIARVVTGPASCVHVWWPLTVPAGKLTKRYIQGVTCLSTGEPHCGCSCGGIAWTSSIRGRPSGRGACPGSLQCKETSYSRPSLIRITSWGEVTRRSGLMKQKITSRDKGT